MENTELHCNWRCTKICAMNGGWRISINHPCCTALLKLLYIHFESWKCSCYGKLSSSVCWAPCMDLHCPCCHCCGARGIPHGSVLPLRPSPRPAGVDSFKGVVPVGENFPSLSSEQEKYWRQSNLRHDGCGFHVPLLTANQLMRALFSPVFIQIALPAWGGLHLRWSTRKTWGERKEKTNPIWEAAQKGRSFTS